MKIGKKVREYKAGDFIFAKVKGYPAWPARVQRPNGKKYFVYFYGTAETANLPPNMIFDYAENKDKFLTKTVKRRDFNDGVKQIEYDFANNVPLEQVIGLSVTEPSNESQEDDSALDATADDTIADESTANTTQNDTMVDDSDDAGLIIDEVKGKGKKPIKAKETPKKEVKTPKPKKNDEEEKKEEEVVSRSGRKIRPKRYIDEHTEENATLQSPAAKKKRAVSPTLEKERKAEKVLKHFHVTPQSELEELKEPFNTEDSDKENILIAYLPSGQYVGIKLFQSRPTNFKNEGARLKWDKQQAANAITLKLQLERGQITAQSVAGQLIMELSLSDEEKAMLGKERELEERKSRLQFLKTEVKMMELDAKIKTCLCLEKADTEMCLKLLDEPMELPLKPLMLLKHPACVETVKRMRAYVGNAASWGLGEAEAVLFSKHAHRIRRQADLIYGRLKNLFSTPEGLSFFEYFTERAAYFKQITSKLSQEDVMEMVYEPIELSQPTSHTMKSAVNSANEITKTMDENKPTGKAKKIASTPLKTPAKKNTKKQEEKKADESEKVAEKEIEESEKEEKQEGNEKEADVEENKETESTEDADANTETSNADTNEETKELGTETEKEETVDKDEKGEKRKLSTDSKSSLDEKDEPKAKRTRESKKPEQPPPKSPAKRKNKV